VVSVDITKDIGLVLGKAEGLWIGAGNLQGISTRRTLRWVRENHCIDLPGTARPKATLHQEDPTVRIDDFGTFVDNEITVDIIRTGKPTGV
jgi:hypothetical protein